MQYECPHASRPGDMCRKAYGDCDLPSYYDKKCQCPLNEFRGATYVRLKVRSRLMCQQSGPRCMLPAAWC
jgi:hypothetical protein